MLLCMPDILAIWEVIFDWFSKHNVSSILVLYKIFSIYIFSTVVVQYFTRGRIEMIHFDIRGQDDSRITPRTTSDWLNSNSPSAALISPSCAAAADQFKFWGIWQTFGMKIRNMFTDNRISESYISFIHSCSNVKVFHWPPFVCSFHNNCHNRRAQLRRIFRQIINCCTR